MTWTRIADALFLDGRLAAELGAEQPAIEHTVETMPRPSATHVGPIAPEVERVLLGLASTWVAEPKTAGLGRALAHSTVADVVDDELHALRVALAADSLAATLEARDIAAETRVYLEHALDPAKTYDDFTLYVRNTLAGTVHGAALAAAAVRGWAHRSALAAGCAR